VTPRHPPAHTDRAATGARHGPRAAALLALLLAAVLLTSACVRAPAAEPSGAGETVTVRAADGRVTVPVTERDIWALDAGTALNLLAIGVVPAHAARTHQGQEAREKILADAGVELVAPHRPERVAAARPALITGTDHPEHRALLGRLETIAPVVLLDDGGGPEAQLTVLGAMTGRPSRAAEAVARAERAVSALAARIRRAGHAGRSVSVLQRYPSVLYAYDSGTRFGTLLSRLGLTRPDAQSGTSPWGFVQISEERLTAHRADIMISLVDRVHTGGRSALGHPMLDTTGALTADVEFSGWYHDDLLGVWWVLHDVRAVLLDGEPPAAFADVPALWREASGRA
jgi:iron complex transport system substrate-binding protein